MNASLKRYLVRELRSDRTYARVVNPRHVQRIVDNFDADAVGIVIANQRRDGRLVLIDGNHRIAAMKQLGKVDDTVEVLLFRNMDVRDEARLFASLNTQLAMHGADVFRAKVIAGDEETILVHKTVIANGFKVTRDQTPGGIRAPRTLYKVHEMGLLEETLGVCRRAWPDLDAELPAVIIRSVAEVLRRYPYADKRHLAKRLRDRGVKRWLLEIRDHARAAGMDASKAGAAKMVTAYNYKRQRNRLGKVT